MAEASFAGTNGDKRCLTAAFKDLILCFGSHAVALSALRSPEALNGAGARVSPELGALTPMQKGGALCHGFLSVLTCAGALAVWRMCVSTLADGRASIHLTSNQ